VDRHILLTGATGYLGRHLLWRLLQDGYHVGVIARSGGTGVEARIRAALAPFGAPDWTRIECFAGDLAGPLLGLDDAQLQRLRQRPVHALLHCAGLTRFDEHLREDLFRANLFGTQQAFALAERLRAGQFHHVSTAFVAGDSQKAFRESDLDMGQGFRNPYEESKFEAETFLHAQVSRTGIPVIRVHRPSIIVGGHPVGERNQASTVYTFIKALRFLRESCVRDLRRGRGRGRFARLGVRQDGEHLYVPMRVALWPEARINLVSLHRVVDEIVTDLRDAGTGMRTRSQLGRDYALGELKEVFARVVGIRGIQLVDECDFAQIPRSAVETLFHRATHEYQPYLTAETHFADDEKDPNDDVDIEAIARDYCALLDAPRPGEPSLAHLALSTLQVDSARDYFAHLVAGGLGSSLLARVAFVDARIRFIVHGERRFDRILHFRYGQARYADEGPWDFGYELSDALFMDIVHGRLDFRRAFFMGRVHITGDTEAALKFGFLLGHYLQHADEHLVDEVVGL
jgi:nucleoside-diphosphate-sugar epimerase